MSTPNAAARGIRLCTNVVAISTLLTVAAVGQDEKIEANDLRAPSVPALALLGVDPSSVERPNTPRAFAMSLVNAINDGGLIPGNFAAEIAPFWWFKHPNLKFDDYYHPNIGQAFVQHFAFSILVSKSTGTSSGLDTTHVGLGARTLLVPGRPTSRLASLRNTLVKVQDSILDVIPDDPEAAEPPELEKLRQEARRLALAIQEEDRRRRGFTMELAGAVLTEFPENDYRQGGVTRSGAWITIGYTHERPRLGVLVLGRYLSNDPERNGSDFADIGGRFLYEPGPLTVAFELVGRWSVNEDPMPMTPVDDDTYRWSGNLEYRATDDVAITVNFGRNFVNTNFNPQTLIALIGLNLGLGARPTASAR